MPQERGPVIAAGSTGSIPATAELIATIAHLPHGAVVLPGLDTDLDAEAWRMIAGDGLDPRAAHGEPDGARTPAVRACRRCSTRIGIERDDGRCTCAKPRGRERLVSEALRPAAATEAVAAARRRPRIRSATPGGARDA